MKQTIETKLGVTIILIFAVTVGAFMWKWERNQPEVQQSQITYNMKKSTSVQNPPLDTIQQGQDNNDQQENEASDSVNTKNWKLCENNVSNYEFKYPNNWILVDRYLTVLNDCYNPSSPRVSSFFIGDNRYSVNNKKFSIEVSTQDNLKGTIFKGVTSLEEYYARNDNFLTHRVKIKSTTIQDDRADWFEEKNDNFVTVCFFHDNILYEIRTDIQNMNLLETILNTFKFPNN